MSDIDVGLCGAGTAFELLGCAGIRPPDGLIALPMRFLVDSHAFLGDIIWRLMVDRTPPLP